MVAPVSGHAFAADEGAVAVVAADCETKRRIRRGFQYARPADREVVFGHSFRRAAFPPPVVLYGGFRAFDHGRPLKFPVGEIGGPQAGFTAVGAGVESASGEVAVPFVAQVDDFPAAAQRLHSVEHRDGRAGVYIAASAARHDPCGVGTHDGDPASAQGQQVVVVFQQHDAFPGQLERRFARNGVLLGDGGVPLVAVEEPERDECLEDVLYLEVDGLLAHQSRFDGFQQVPAVHELSGGHFQIEASVRGAHTRIGGIPVGHEDTFETPCVAQRAHGEINEAGTYTVRLVVTGNNGTTDQSENRIVIRKDDRVLVADFTF